MILCKSWAGEKLVFACLFSSDWLLVNALVYSEKAQITPDPSLCYLSSLFEQLQAGGNQKGTSSRIATHEGASPLTIDVSLSGLVAT